MAMNPYEMRWEFLQKAQERLEYQLSHNVSRWSEMKELGQDPGPYPEYPTASQGHAVAEELKLDMDKPGDKAKVKAIVKQWMKTNVLKAAEMYDKRQGRDVQCVVVGEMIRWDEV